MTHSAQDVAAAFAPHWKANNGEIHFQVLSQEVQANRKHPLREFVDWDRKAAFHRDLYRQLVTLAKQAESILISIKLDGTAVESHSRVSVSQDSTGEDTEVVRIRADLGDPMVYVGETRRDMLAKCINPHVNGTLATVLNNYSVVLPAKAIKHIEAAIREIEKELSPLRAAA